MKYVILKNGVVTDLVRVNPINIFPRGYASQFVQVPDEVEAGWMLVEGEYQAPPTLPPAVPQTVTMRQARLALLGAGLLAGVDAAIAGLSEPAKSAALIDWEFASTIDRNFGMVPMMAAALGLTETQIDDLFIQAAAL